SLVKAVLEEKGAERVIIFARTRSRADSTARRLKRAGYNVEAIHSDRSQNQRKRALDRFSAGEVNILTATDVLARGIDVTEVDYVINYDLPTQPEDYVHRIGRTGRAGAAGFSVSFVTPETEDALKDIQKLIKQDIPEMKLASFDFSEAEAEAAAKQMEFQAKRDPEIAAAKKELRAKAQRKAHKREAALEASPAKRRGAKKKPAPARPKPETGGKRSQNRAQMRGDSTGGATAKGRGAAGDFRPGRAQRAAAARRRTRP
ncbi:MAG: helicase C-terminal domain-containing protein, partial [Berryella intestinalis]|nr:helicase C-terminal domain-containing protein [Berryella intestinalis]